MRDEEYPIYITEVSKLFAGITNVANEDEEETASTLSSAFVKLAEDQVKDDKKLKEDFYNDFEKFIEELQPSSKCYKFIHKQDVYPLWGFWAFLHETPLEYGYSVKHHQMKQSKSNPSGRHVYSGRPKQISWKLTPVIDGGKVRFFTGLAPINEIDAVSSVPSIRHGIKIFTASKRILDTNLRLDEWQRELTPKRLQHISKFLDNSDNSFANSCMIFAPNHSSVHWKLDPNDVAREVIVDFQYLKEDPVQKKNYLTDHFGSKDLRPLQIIDGQHRVRGGMRSKRGHRLKIPFILFPPELKNSGAAKYFAEINTLSEELHILHEIFMRHKFGLTSTKEAKKFAHYDGTKSTFRDRANRLAYEAAAYINIHSEAMGQLIQVLAENPENNTIISADMWIQFAYPWFMQTGPYPPSGMEEDKGKYFQEISNFFDAFQKITNQDWSDGKDRWLDSYTLKSNDAGGNKPAIQFSLCFRALLVLLPKIVSRIREEGYSQDEISIDRFCKSLKFLSNVDWLSTELKKYYTKSSEYPWKSLSQWMFDAMSRGEVEAYTILEVMSSTHKSIAGKGIVAELEKGEIKFADPSHKWPKPNQPVEIIVSRPINATRSCTGYLYDTEQNRMEHKAGCKVTGFAKQNNQYSYFIHHWDQIIQYEKLVFTCTWRNAIHGQGGLTSRIELKP
jgi:hypothetical protein